MSKSFSMRLSDFVISRPIGLKEKLLNRIVDVSDVVSILSDEGFINFNEQRTFHNIHGRDLSSLRERISAKVLGIPRDAYVSIDGYGPGSDYLVITFDY